MSMRKFLSSTQDERRYLTTMAGENAQVVNLPTYHVFAKLGVIHRCSRRTRLADLHFAPSRVGIARLAGAYAWQSLIKSGAIIPEVLMPRLSAAKPMIEFYAAVRAQRHEGVSGEGWHPQEAATREQALKMFTIWPAYAAFEETLRVD